MDLVNLETASVEQKFLLMMAERLEMVEGELDMCKKKLFPDKFSQESDALFCTLRAYNDAQDKIEFDKERDKLLERMPEDLRKEISDWELKNLKAVLDRLPLPAVCDEDIVGIMRDAYMAFIWLRGIKSVRVIAWLRGELEKYTGLKL